MHLKWNQSFNRVLASSVAAVLATTSLNAIPRDPCEPPPPQICCEEPKPGPFAFAYPFDMDLNCPRDFYFHVDALAFQAKQDGLEYAIQDSTTPGAGNPISNGVVEGFSGSNRDYDYNPGVRVGLGFYLDHDAWNLDFNWTWLNITNYQKSSASITNGARLIPIWALGDGTTINQMSAKVSSRWDVKYNTFDISLGKPHYVSRYLVMNPFFGLRGGWISQHYGVDYGGAPNALTNRTVNRNDNDFWGVGARAGLNSDWLLGRGWCLFGNLAASMLFGKFEIDQHYQIALVNEGYDIDYNFYQNVPNFEIALGIGWGKYFNKKRNHVSLRAAYEFHEWWNQNNLRKFSSGPTGTVNSLATSTGIYTNDTVARGNFTLNGFSFKLQFDI